MKRLGTGRSIVLVRLFSGLMLVVAMTCGAQAAAEADHGDSHAAEAEHGHGHGHAPGHPTDPLSPAFDPAEYRSDLALWTFVVFLVLLAVLWKFAWGPIAAGLDKREQTIHDHLAAAERSHDDAKQMLAEYERKLASAAGDVKAMLEEARRDAEHTKQQILVEAKTAADAERARALRDVEAATDAALKQIAEQGANLAVDLAGKIVGANLSGADHSRLITDAMSKFPAGTPSRN